jgi:hypothetical protein
MTEEEFRDILARGARSADDIIYAYGAIDEHEINRRMRCLNGKITKEMDNGD